MIYSHLFVAYVTPLPYGIVRVGGFCLCVLKPELIKNNMTIWSPGL